MDGPELVETIVALIESGADPDVISRFLGIEADVVEQVALFRRSGEHRLIMTIARRGTMPFSEAQQRWGNLDDRVKEIAWDVLQYQETELRCPNGHNPNDVEDVSHPKGRRPLKNGRLKIVKEGCFTCNALASVEEGMTDKERKQGAFVRMRPRSPGDPFKP